MIAIAHPDAVRQAHRRFPTGVTVVTTMAVDGTPRGLAVNAFASISLDPPMVLVCIARTSRSYAHLVRATRVGINLLAADQEHLALTFAGTAEDKFAGVEWELSAAGVPLLRGTSAYLEVAPETLALASSHVVLVGHVVATCCSDKPPLLYLAGAFYDSSGLATPAASSSKAGT